MKIIAVKKKDRDKFAQVLFDKFYTQACFAIPDKIVSTKYIEIPFVTDFGDELLSAWPKYPRPCTGSFTFEIKGNGRFTAHKMMFTYGFKLIEDYALARWRNLTVEYHADALGEMYSKTFDKSMALKNFTV